MIIGKVLEIMDERGLTADAFAEKTGLALKVIMRARYDIEECSLSTLSSIAAALGTSVKDLFDEIPPKIGENLQELVAEASSFSEAVEILLANGRKITGVTLAKRDKSQS